MAGRTGLSERVTKRQQRAAATADQLLAAARETFEARGYQATTVGAITEAANTAHGTFYLYFKNKEDAFAKVMEQVVERIYQEARSPWEGDPYEALVHATRGFLEVFREHRGLFRCLLEGLHTSKTVEEMWLELRRPFIERIARNLQNQIDLGIVRPLNPAIASHALGAMVEWFAFAHFELGEPSPDDVDIDTAARGLADLWMHAVFGMTSPRPPRS